MNENRVGIFSKIILAVLTVIFLFPFLICILMSVKSKQETSLGILSLPKMIHWENFTTAMEKAKILLSMKNSLIITICSVIIILLVASTAAYAIGRQYKKRFYRFYETLLVGSMMLPFQVIMVPVYRMYKNLNMLNTRTGAVIMLSLIHI